MINSEDIQETKARFLLALFEKTEDEKTGQASMYEVGDGLGMDRDASQRIAEELMADGLVEVRTLSGGIGITDGGIESVRKKGGGGGSDGPGLGNSLVVDGENREAVEQVVAFLKVQTGSLGLSFDPLSELIADLRTIEIQMMSPCPKTDIIRACFGSVSTVLEKAGAAESLTRVTNLLGG